MSIKVVKLQRLRKLNKAEMWFKVLMFGVLILISCGSKGQGMVDLIGIWVGDYNDYSYTISIDEQGSCRIVQNEVNKTMINTKVNCEGDSCMLSIVGEEYRLIMEQGKSLRVLPANKKSKDVRILCLVQFKRISKTTDIPSLVPEENEE